ncbi:prepilin peptidase [Mesoterricola sediminis]|uniref:Prepilin peptidase n=1 Tax=Mesoterricola sediminis TaxID=2927980 RepID=A0AA48GVL3_9BACT|nr:A24 family peptidase [Mesoterricola sediminis]BDU78624.1 prepilin peptidase [Mesoterricola sediminis]
MPAVDFPTWFLSLVLAPFGLLLGSFANVLIHRLPLEAPADRDVVRKPSHCPACKARIRPVHNIPVLSWIWLRGRCAACGARIPIRYPLVELLGGALLAGSVWVFPIGTLIWAKGVICGYALIVLFFTDLTAFILPDAIQFPLMGLGVLLTLPQLAWPFRLVSVWAPGPSLLQVDATANGIQPAPAWPFLGGRVTWLDSLLGLAIGYGVPWLLNRVYRAVRKTDGIGMGDFKMLAWLGAFWGWGPMLGILFGGALLGSAVGLPLMLFRKTGGQTMLPFGCTLALATPVVVFYGPALWMAYLGVLR